MKLKFTNIYSKKWQCSVKLLLVIESPEIFIIASAFVITCRSCFMRFLFAQFHINATRKFAPLFEFT